MGKCKVLLSNGTSLIIDSSTSDFIKLITEKNGRFKKEPVPVTEEKKVYYINPRQIVSVSDSDPESSGRGNKKKKSQTKKKKDQEKNEERAQSNLEAVKDLSKDIDNME